MAYSQVDVSTTLNNAKTVLDAFLRNKISRHTDSNDEVFKRIFTLRKAIEYNPYDFGSTEYEDLVGELNSVLEVFGYLLPHEPLVDEFVASDVTGLVSYPPIISDSTIRTTTTYSSYKIESRLSAERATTNADIATVQGEVDALEARVGTAEANIVNQGVALGELTDRVSEAESDILSLIGNDTTINNRITTEVATLQTQINTVNSEIDALQAEIEDEENIKGGYRAVATLTDLYTIDPVYLKQNVTMAYVADTGKEYRLTSLVNAGNSTGWTEVVFISEGGGGGAVVSFNGRVGSIVLTSADVATALGYTPFNYATGSDSFIKNQATLQTGSKFYVDYGKFTKGVVLGGGALTTEIGTGEAGFYIGNLSGVSDIPSGGVNDGVWGAITGTLSNQTDLQTALNGKLGASATAVNSTKWNGQEFIGANNSIGAILTNQAGTNNYGYSTVSQIQSWLGLGSNAYSSTAYLPLSGGTLTGASSGNTLQVINTSASGYGLYSRGGNGLQYSLLLQDYAGTTVFDVRGNGSVNLYGPLTGTSATFSGNVSSSKAFVSRGLNDSWVGGGVYMAYNPLGYGQIGTYNYTSGGWENLILNAGGGNVGIGTTSVGSKLHVAGTFRNALASGAGGQTLISAITGASNGYLINVDTANNITHQWHTGGNAISLSIASSGNVNTHLGFSPPSTAPSVTEASRSYIWVGNLSGITNVPA